MPLKFGNDTHELFFNKRFQVVTLKAISVKIRIVSIMLHVCKNFICIYSLLSRGKGWIALHCIWCMYMFIDSDKRPDPSYIRIGPPNHRACCKRQLKWAIVQWIWPFCPCLLDATHIYVKHLWKSTIFLAQKITSRFTYFMTSLLTSL